MRKLYFPYRMGGRMNISKSGRSIRNECLQRIAANADLLGVKIPQSVLIPSQHISTMAQKLDAVPEERKQWVRSAAFEFASRASRFDEPQLFVRAQPLDEAAAPHLSFAGVYKSFVPISGITAVENISLGLMKVLGGRCSPYADYYYERHAINGHRDIDIMISPFTDEGVGFGTGYSNGHNVLFEFFDTALSVTLHRPNRHCGYGGTALERKIARILTAIAELLKFPVDVEYLITRNEEVVVSQVRPISQAHLALWEKLDDKHWREAEGHTATILPNSTGNFSGTIIDLRCSKLVKDDLLRSEALFLINHHDVGHGESSLSFLHQALAHDLSDMKVLVDHGRTIVCDHLAYAMREDPGISFLAHLDRVPSQSLSGQTLRINSNGFDAPRVALPG